ncbi:MAG: thioredoxin family protein [Clostridia bacterium]|nr:thioredoxin family protein [Clostridia bacterium]
MSIFDKLSGGASAIKSILGSDITITVLSDGNSAAKSLIENAEIAVNKLNVPVKVECVTDSAIIAQYGDVKLPALAVGGKVVFQGSIPKADEIEALIKKFVK